MTPVRSLRRDAGRQRRDRHVRHRGLGLHGRAGHLPGRRHPLHPGACTSRAPATWPTATRASSGRHGVCIGQNGPGITNFVTAIAAAYWAHSPVVIDHARDRHACAWASAASRKPTSCRSFQDHQVPGPRATNPTRMAEFTAPLLRPRACSSMGPTQLNIPRDYFYGEIDCEIPQADRASSAAPAASRASTRRPSCWPTAKFPVIIAGGGVVMADGVDECEGARRAPAARRSSTATCTTTRSRPATRCGAARSATRARRRR